MGLLQNNNRFELAVWLAFTELGMKPYTAAYLTTFLIASHQPIDTESVEGILLKSSTTFSSLTASRVIGHADRIRRHAPVAVSRASDEEFAWLTHSAGLIVALLKFTARNDARGIITTLNLLNEAGWTETLMLIRNRIHDSLLSDFPPAEGPLSRTVKRLLRDLHQH